MNFKRIIAGCIVAVACTSVACPYGNDTLTDRLEGSIYTEANYGHRFDSPAPNRWDFPHVVIAAAADLGRGWSVEAELEYERMYEEGAWSDDHWDNLSTNRLFVAKSWSEAVGVRVGMVGVPLGITNGGGPALTIYDPVSEAALMPMTWHETGCGLFGSVGRWSYEVAALFHGALPLNDCRTLGVAAALHYSPVEGVRIGAGVFHGRTDHGNIYRCGPSLTGRRDLTYGVVEADVERDGWTASASWISSDAGGARSVGAEAGYDVMTLTGESRLSLTPYARYDGVFDVPGAALNKWTAGVAVGLPAGFTVKAEYGSCRFRSADTERSIDLSVGYELKF